MKNISILVILLLAACGTQPEPPDHEVDHQSDATKYTCPMHPQIVRASPGTCPICGMELVRMSPSVNGNAIMLTDAQVKLANINTRKAARRTFGETVVVNATLTPDQDKTQVISARVAGRVDKLYIKEIGRVVTKGSPLYELYSEFLLTLQQEYLLAKDQYEALGQTEPRYKSFMEAARRKLLLYGLSERQIVRLDRREPLQPRVTFLSPATGVITELKAKEGQYVAEGGALYQIEDISSLWVEAELYPSEAGLVKHGDTIRVQVSGRPSIIEAIVTFLSPQYRPGSQVVLMRAQLDNKEGSLKPGQLAQVFFTHSSRAAIALPTDAVIREEKGAHVFVQTGYNRFEPRMVKTGLEGVDQVEITEGLTEGDTVVVNGAYLLYSEMILKKGSTPMAGHSQH